MKKTIEIDLQDDAANADWIRAARLARSDDPEDKEKLKAMLNDKISDQKEPEK